MEAYGVKRVKVQDLVDNLEKDKIEDDFEVTSEVLMEEHDKVLDPILAEKNKVFYISM